MSQTGQRLQIGKNIRKNIFVTQINEREEDEPDTQIPVVRDSGSHLLETGLNTLQKTLVLKREAELAKVDSDLLAKRLEFKERMDKCTTRRIELQRRQQSVKDQVKKFDQFIRENEAKRRRAISKFQEESRLNEVKSHEEESLRVALRDVKKTHKLMKHRVKQYKKYEEYLHRVIEILPPDYIKADDNPLAGIMMRHNTLSGTNSELLAQMNDKLDENQDIAH